MNVQEYNDIMAEEVKHPLSWIGNYFYNSGKYTVEGSPYSEKGNNAEYKLFEWLERCEWVGKEPLTILFALVLAIEYRYLVPIFKNDNSNVEIYNVMCGRSSYRQKVLDAVVDEMIKKRESNK